MIRVNQDYVIDVDEWNYTLMYDCHKTKIVKDKDGNESEEPVYKTLGHFNKLESALEGVIKDRVAKKLKDEDVSLKEAIEEIRKIREIYNELFREVLKDK